MTSQREQTALLARIATALESLAGVAPPSPSLPAACLSFIWQTKPYALQPVDTPATIPLSLLCGVDSQADTLLANSQQFAKGLSANHALLWGARGVGKSSLIKSVWAEINQRAQNDSEKLTLVEIYRQDIASLPRLLAELTPHADRHFIIFCDDLTFDTSGDSGGGGAGGGSEGGNYKSLKTVLEGGLLATPRHILFYATSNRRHLMGRTMQDGQDGQDQYTISGRETIDERVSLSDRFGLWLGFYAIDQVTYLKIIEKYADAIGWKNTQEARANLEKSALEWARSRGDMSGRVAWQFIMDAAGRAGVALEFNEKYLRQI
ncbi:MAG: ATP-binding protein [Proteobacteria bacterium]|nr:ATP-binding protein [Pseudomonadota bacterium]